MNMSSYTPGLTITLALLVGCADPNHGKARVQGTVTFGGEPVAMGTITFQPLERGAVPGAAAVVEGKFTALLIPAQYQVRVEVPRRLDGPWTYEEDARQRRRRHELMGKIRMLHGDREAINAELAKYHEAEGTIPGTAPGNNRVFQVVEGEQTLDVVIEKDSKKKNAPAHAGR